jgi:hypothetical protein
MAVQVIIFGGVSFCVVFEVENHIPRVITKGSFHTRAELLKWLDENGYPNGGLLLQERQGANLPHGYYMRPHITELYFSVHEDNTIQPVAAECFGETIPTMVDGF